MHESSDLRSIRCIALCFALTATVGCSADSSKGTVAGTVTFDGNPIKSGVIRFVPIDGESPTAEAIITDGKFSETVPIGEKRISISAPKVVGKRPAYQTPGAPSVDIVEELLPARYNLASELTLDVQGGRQNVAFGLESGK